MFVHHHAHVEVRGQLEGLGSFLLPCGSWGQTHAIKLDSHKRFWVDLKNPLQVTSWPCWHWSATHYSELGGKVDASKPLYLSVKHEPTMCIFHNWRRWWTSTASLPHWPYFTFIVILECVPSTHDKNLLWIILNSLPCFSGNSFTCLLTWHLFVAARGHAEWLMCRKVCVSNFCRACSWRDSITSWWFNSNWLDLESPRRYSSRCVCEDISERFNWGGKMCSIYSMKAEVC